MENLNEQWFVWMAAGFQPQPWVLVLATWCAVYGGWLMGAIAVWLVVQRATDRWYLVGSLVVCLVAVLIAQRLAVAIGHPRPFMVGLSPAYVSHGARGSLPSAHASALFSVAFCWLWSARLRAAGWAALVIAAAVGWGRVYIGVHFPFDIVAGALLGAFLATMYAIARKRWGHNPWKKARATSADGAGPMPVAGVPNSQD